MKFSVSLVLVVLAFATTSGSKILGSSDGKGFPATFDCNENVDRTTAFRNSVPVSKEGVWFRRVEAFVDLPITGGAYPNPIVCIEVADLSLKGVGGYITRISGGVGEKHAKLHITSQIGRGFKFQITVYYG